MLKRRHPSPLRPHGRTGQPRLELAGSVFRDLVEAAPDAMAVVNAHGDIVLVNSQTERLFGWKRHELLGRKIEVLIPERFQRRHAAYRTSYSHYPRARSMGAGLDLYGRYKDGTEFPVEVSLSPLETPQGLLVSSSIRDITDRKEAEETLHKEREFLKALLENLSEGVVACDEEGALTLFNQALRDIHGLPADSIPPAHWAEHYNLYLPGGKLLIPEEQLPLLRALRGEAVRNVEIVIAPRDKPARTVLVSGQPIVNRSGHRLGAVAVTHDITERKRAEEALRSSQHDYEALVNSIDGIVWELDARTFEFRFVSRRAESMLGYPLSSWFDTPNAWVKYLHPEDRDWALDFCLTETRAKRDHIFEYRMLTADGRTLWLQDRVSVVVEDGEPVALRGVILDITQRKQAEEALQASEQAMAEAQRMAHLGHFSWDFPSNCFTLSEEFYRIYGLAPGTSLDLDALIQCIHPGDRARIIRRTRHMLEERSLPRGGAVDYRIVRPDGAERYVSSESYVWTNEKGEITGVKGFVQEVTERKERERLLSENQMRLKLLLDIATGSTEGVSAQDVIQHAVDRLAEAFPELRAAYATLDRQSLLSVLAAREPEGLPPLAGRRTSLEAMPEYLAAVRSGQPLVVPDTAATPLYAPLADALHSGTRACLQVPVRHSEELLGLLSLEAPTAHAWTAHEVATLTAVAQQLTVAIGDALAREERRHVQEALAQKARELARSNEELEQFAYVASHDLQEPLRTVASYTQLLAQRYRGKLDDQADEFVGFVTDAVHHMQGLIEGLLAYGRVTRRGQDFIPTALDSAVTTALLNLKGTIEASGASVSFDPLPTVSADGAQLVQVLQNLISNAIKYRSQEPPRVHVSAERQGDDWVISVRDNGIGVDPRHAGRIFVLFQRLHTRDQYPGSGIGLAICKKIVERHGGHIWVEPGNPGSVFRFSLRGG